MIVLRMAQEDQVVDGNNAFNSAFSQSVRKLAAESMEDFYIVVDKTLALKGGSPAQAKMGNAPCTWEGGLNF